VNAGGDFVTRIDFYVIAEDAPNATAVTACRLVEKAHAKGHRVYLHAESDEQARAVDTLLWTFRQNSFIPHEFYGSRDGEWVPVLVGCHPDPQVEPEVLVNLAPTVPAFFSRFRRLVELVGADPDARRRSRERFRYYSEQGYPLNTHHV